MRVRGGGAFAGFVDDAGAPHHATSDFACDTCSKRRTVLTLPVKTFGIFMVDCAPVPEYHVKSFMYALLCYGY